MINPPIRPVSLDVSDFHPSCITRSRRPNSSAISYFTFSSGVRSSRWIGVFFFDDIVGAFLSFSYKYAHFFLFNASWRLSPTGIIKQRNRNLCDTGSVRKSRKINGFTTTFRLHNGYNPSIEFIIIGQSRHEKDLVLCLMRILARCVEVLRQFDFPLKGRSELFEPRRGEF